MKKKGSIDIGERKMPDIENMEEYLFWKFVLLSPAIIGLFDFMFFSYLKRKCTETVSVMLKVSCVNSDGTETYKVVYEYDNSLYEARESGLVFHVQNSENHEIKVNPNNPEMYYCPSRQKKHLFTDLFLVAMGIYLITHINF
ncbi:hypothetical protein [Ruminococcus sp.]|uniref:hypothetical protein n=1 Tax=Ruminococcus sp. TaxID=41978 RepID=UPI0025F92CEB|nr:hypothetical protein [Ruminococcus sp.]